MSDVIARLTRMRASDPEAVASALAKRERGMLSFPRKLFLVAADHPGRGVLAAGGDPRAMADRGAFLDRLTTALAHPEVDGVLATADIVDDLALLGALGEKVVFGSMNRGGLAGSVFELDDRFTGYTAAAIARDGLNGGKMMLRVADDDSGTVRTMEACAAAVDALGALGLHAMIEVFASRTVDGKSSNDLSVEATMRAIAVASALGGSSARTWLKLPVMDEQERLLSATTLPVVLLGGD
ncbi:MAG TPA: deoxyribose-phosphate aldolase, partial [Candidatus Saccharimonadales bacterium]|nr:deoxyribose-phosphate aldolase [Candidatus Saccharimonadales bacterium]